LKSYRIEPCYQNQPRRPSVTIDKRADCQPCFLQLSRYKQEAQENIEMSYQRISALVQAHQCDFIAPVAD
jgi:hypothetical protein